MSIVVALTIAYHSAALFEEPAAEGGGDGILYTGSPSSNGFDCGICHLDAPGDITLAPSSDPLELLTKRVYEPGATYDFTIAMQGETKGLGTKGNYNSIAVEVLDGNGERVGGFFGYDADAMITLAADGALFSRGTRDQSEWTFSWQAPEEGTGYVDFYLVAVDGDGAGDLDATASDPYNDDVVAGGFRIAELGTEAPPFDRTPERRPAGTLGANRDVSACSVAPNAPAPLALLLLLFACRLRSPYATR